MTYTPNYTHAPVHTGITNAGVFFYRIIYTYSMGACVRARVHVYMYMFFILYHIYIYMLNIDNIVIMLFNYSYIMKYMYNHEGL